MTNLTYQPVRYTTVSGICSTIDYGHTASAAPLKDGPRFLRITDIQNGRVDWSAVPGCEINATEEIALGIRDGDIVFARTGATTGKSFLIQSPPRAVFASYLIRLRLDRAQAIPRYVYLFFQSERYWEQLREFARGAAQPNVNATLLGKIEIPLPPLAEQERIAARLTEQLAVVESTRAAAQARLAAAEALPAAYLREVFEGPEASEWLEKELGDGLVAIEAGTSVVALDRPARASEWGVLKVSALSWGRFMAEENKAVPPGYTPAQHEEVRAGDLLISRANTTELAGAIVLVRDTPPRLMLSDKTLRLVIKADVFSPAFLVYAVRAPSARRFIEGNATGTSYSMRNISQDTIRCIPVAAPPLTEQRRIAAALAIRLAEAARLTAILRDELAAIDALSAALLRDAFNGQA